MWWRTKQCSDEAIASFAELREMTLALTAQKKRMNRVWADHRKLYWKLHILASNKRAAGHRKIFFLCWVKAYFILQRPFIIHEHTHTHTHTTGWCSLYKKHVTSIFPIAHSIEGQHRATETIIGCPPNALENRCRDINMSSWYYSNFWMATAKACAQIGSGAQQRLQRPKTFSYVIQWSHNTKHKMCLPYTSIIFGSSVFYVHSMVLILMFDSS